MEFHTTQLNKCCRVCGKRLLKAKGKGNKHIYNCVENVSLLSEAFGIEVASDDGTVHPSYFCMACHSIARRKRESTVKQCAYRSKKDHVFTWAPHQDTDCTMCAHFEVLCNGGGSRQSKVNKGRSRGETPTAVIRSILDIAPPSFFPQSKPHTCVHTFTDDTSCHLCERHLDRPLELECGKMVCAACIIERIQVSCELICPCCHCQPLDSTHFRAPSTVTMGVLGNFILTCGECHRQVKVRNFLTHIESQCTSQIEFINSPSKTTISEILGKSPDTAPSPSEIRVAGNVIKRMISHDSAGDVIKVPTGSHGQPLTLMQVPACRKPSSEASKKTVLNRSHQLSKIRETVSGGDSLVQLQSEIRCLSKEERESLLKGVGLPITIPAEHVLAMKANLCIPWAKMRLLSRWFKTLSVSLASERRQRDLAKKLLQHDNLVVENGAFTFNKGQEIKEVPFGYVPNLTRKVADCIAAHEGSKDGLTWHDAIPPNELWIKFGGDKGHGSFKFNMQLCNTLHPNSQKNTCLISMFLADDSATNLHTGLDMYREQIKELQKEIIGGRKVAVFLSGDYEFLSRMYGLTGANGRHCCLWCTIESSELKKPLSVRGRSPMCDLKSLKDDHKKFLEKGGGDLKNAKLHNNVIGEYLFDIPLTNVCIPGLHISLGIFNRIWELLQDACNDLDLIVARQSGSMDATTYGKYRQALIDLMHLREKHLIQEEHLEVLGNMATFFMLNLPNPSSDPLIAKVRAEAATLKKNIKSTEAQVVAAERKVREDFKPENRPFYGSLEKGLQSLNIQRQAYQGGTFVGNHVHKLLKPRIRDIFLGNILDQGERSGPLFFSLAKSLHEKFRSLFSLFEKTHRMYNGNVLTTAEIDQLESDIVDFMSYYRGTFPSATILVKMHILEDHVIPWLRRWNIGAGLMGEQGAESVHAHVHKIETNYLTIPNKVDRLKYMFDMYSLETTPALQSIQPPPRPKKRKTEE